MKTSSVRERRVKAWALVVNDLRYKGLVSFGTSCVEHENDDEYYLAVYEQKDFAINAIKRHKDFYNDSVLVPCTITYTLPKKNPSLKKKLI